MTELSEGRLTFRFPDGYRVGRYDEWAFYRNQFQYTADSKAVDFVCADQDECWLIEIKDYAIHPRTKPSELPQEVANKVRDTLSGLAAARRNANNDDERALAREALRSRKWRVALHLEQPQHQSRLRPKRIDPASVSIKLRKVVRGIDPHARVCDSSSAWQHWSVSTN